MAVYNGKEKGDGTLGVTGKKWDILDTSPSLTAAYMQMCRNMCIYIHKHMSRQ